MYVYQELNKQDHPLARVTEVDKYMQRESNFLQTAEGDKIEVLVTYGLVVYINMCSLYTCI